jgi:hypothetical protein
MRSFLTRWRTLTTRRHLLVAASGTAAASVALVLTLTGSAQAGNEPPYLQPAPSTQQLQPWSGLPDGQTLSPASYAAVGCVGSTAYISVHLILTNRPFTTFQPAYRLDRGTWTWTDALFMTSWDGTGSASFALHGLAAGIHEVFLDINNRPYPGYTYYLNETANHGGGIGIYFACSS